MKTRIKEVPVSDWKGGFSIKYKPQVLWSFLFIKIWHTPSFFPHRWEDGEVATCTPILYDSIEECKTSIDNYVRFKTGVYNTIAL